MNVNYTLTPESGRAISGDSVPAAHLDLSPGTWTCTYVSGGAIFKSIKPSASQSLVANGTITFTLDFELQQDAAIEFVTWTLNGSPWQGEPSQIEAVPCMMVDSRFKQWVEGCEGYNVTMNETSWLMISQLNNGAPPAIVVVVDDWCAVHKTPAPHQKVSQMPSVDNVTRLKGYNATLLPGGPAVLLDAHTQWELERVVNYTKNINWFGISVGHYNPELHPCVLFELVLPAPWIYQFQIQTGADVTVVGDTDVDPGNNQDTSGHPIMLIVNAT